MKTNLTLYITIEYNNITCIDINKKVINDIYIFMKIYMSKYPRCMSDSEVNTA